MNRVFSTASEYIFPPVDISVGTTAVSRCVASPEASVELT